MKAGDVDAEGGGLVAMNSAKRQDWKEETEKKAGAAELAPDPADTAADDPAELRLGLFLSAARERRGIAQDAAIKDTKIPAHYLRMLESNDYSKISDQLYLLPFLRRYATYLALEPEEIAMRFVREVQRADNLPPIRIDAALLPEQRRQYNWIAIGGVVVLLAIIVFAYTAIANHHAEGAVPTTSNSAPNPPAGAHSAP